MALVKITGYECNRCGHVWPPKSLRSGNVPMRCPECHSPYWNKERIRKMPKSKMARRRSTRGRGKNTRR